MKGVRTVPILCVPYLVDELRTPLVEKVALREVSALKSFFNFLRQEVYWNSRELLLFTFFIHLVLQSNNNAYILQRLYTCTQTDLTITNIHAASGNQIRVASVDLIRL